MDWFYSADGKRMGPVSGEQLDELLRGRTINGDTLVWRSGMTDWQPLRVARAVPPPPIPPVIAPPVGDDTSAACVECRQWFLQNDMVFLNKCWVCAQCKAIFIQRLAEGAAPAPGAGLLWRFKKQFVMRLGSDMPERCVSCNAPAQDAKLKRQLSWHPPAYYLLIFAGLLVYIILAIIVGKKAVLHIGLCSRHRSQRRWAIAYCCFGVMAGLVMFFGGLADGNGWVAMLGIVLLISGAVLGVWKGTIVSAAKIDREFVWVKGACEAYLAELPEWTDAR